MDKLLTTNEVADLLRTPAASLRFWRHAGTGPKSFRLGKRVVYAEDDVTAWLNSRRDADPRAHRDSAA